jgi:hypothetical protein
MNPFKYWIPLPLMRQTAGDELFGVSIDGGGILSVMSDPTDTNYLILNAYMDVRSLMAAGSLQWLNYGLGFPLQITLSDDLNKTRSTVYRETRASIAASLSYGLGNERLRLKITPSFEALFYAWDPGNDTNPYTWDYEKPSYAANVGLGISNLLHPSWALFGQGFSLTAYGKFRLDQNLRQNFPIPRLEGFFTAAAEPWLPLRLGLYGAWDKDGMDLWGQSFHYSGASFAAIASAEYPRQAQIPLEWLAGGEAELKLFSLDIQKNLSHLYFRRFYGTLAYRGAVYDDLGYYGAAGTPLGDSGDGSYRLAQSLVLRLGLDISTIILPRLPISFAPYVLGAWKFPNMNDDNDDNDYFIGFGISVAY